MFFILSLSPGYKIQEKRICQYMRIERKEKNIMAGFPRFESIERYNSMTDTRSEFRIMHRGQV